MVSILGVNSACSIEPADECPGMRQRCLDFHGARELCREPRVNVVLKAQHDD